MRVRLPRVKRPLASFLGPWGGFQKKTTLAAARECDTANYRMCSWRVLERYYKENNTKAPQYMKATNKKAGPFEPATC